MSKSRKFSTRKMAIVGLLGGISIVLGMTPIGFIPVGPTRATIMHIPVIICAILEGPVAGALVGLIFGLFSLFQAIFNPTPVSFAFLNPLVSIVPRVLIGITTYYVYKSLNKLGNNKTLILLNAVWIAIAGYLGYGIYDIIINAKSVWLIVMNVVLIVLTLIIAYFTNRSKMNKPLDIVVSAVAGTMTNTVLVLGMIYLLYAESFVKALGLDTGLSGKIIFGIGVTNGIPESIIAVLIVTGVVSAIKKSSKERY